MIILFLEIIITYLFAQSLFDVSNNKRTKLALIMWSKRFDEMHIKNSKNLKLIAIALYVCAVAKIVIATIAFLSK